MTTIVAEALDYTKYNYTHGTYHLTQITQNTGLSSITSSVAGGSSSIFELPPKVFNLAKSKLRYTLTPPASGAGNYNWFTADGIPSISQIQLYTRSGLMLVDIRDFDKYTNIMFRRENLIEEVQTWDKPGSIAEGLACCNSTATTNYRPTDAAGGKTNYLEPVYLTIGTANATTPVVNVNINLDILKNTLFAKDQDLYFNGEVMLLKIVWSASFKMYFYKASATDPTGATAAGGNVNISNLNLYLALESNPAIERMIMTKCQTADGL